MNKKISSQITKFSNLFSNERYLLSFVQIAIGFLIWFSASGTTAFALENDLKTRYQKLQSSWFSDVLEFQCGGSIFKLEKTVFSGTSLYLKQDLEWLSVKNLVLKPSGITFEGLGIKGGGVPNRDLIKQIVLPSRDGKPSKIQFRENFLRVLENTDFINYSYQIDFYKQRLEQKNSQKIVNFIMLNHSKYEEYNMSYRKSSEIFSMFSCARKLRKMNLDEYNIALDKCKKEYEIKEKAQDEAQQKENRIFVKKAFSAFHEPIEITTPLGGNVIIKYCHQI